MSTLPNCDINATQELRQTPIAIISQLGQGDVVSRAKRTVEAALARGEPAGRLCSLRWDEPGPALRAIVISDETGCIALYEIDGDSGALRFVSGLNY